MSRLQRTRRWSRETINATPSQFRRSLSGNQKASVKLAEHAGKRMAKQMIQAGKPSHKWKVKDLDPIQVEVWRRRFGVPKNRTNVMLCVAWAALRKWNLRHSLYKLTRPQAVRSWRKASKQEVTRKPRRANIATCVHDRPYFRVCQTCKRNKEEARVQLERLLALHLSPADSKKLLRWLRTRKTNQEFWKLVRRKLGIATKTPTYHHGALSYRRFMYHRRRSFTCKTVSTNRRRWCDLLRQHPDVTPSEQVVSMKRLVPEKVANAPTLCIDMDAMFHARCNRPVRSGKVFCEICSPRKERI